MTKKKKMGVVVFGILILFIDVIAFMCSIVLFDSSAYYGTAGDCLTYENLFTDSSTKMHVTYWYDSFRNASVIDDEMKEEFQRIESILQQTDYRTISKLSGRIIALFQNKMTVKGRIGLSNLPAENGSDRSDLSSSVIYSAKILKLFGKYYLYYLHNTQIPYDGFSVCKMINTDLIKNSEIINRPGVYYRRTPLNYPKTIHNLVAPKYIVLYLLGYTVEVIVLYKIYKRKTVK